MFIDAHNSCQVARSAYTYKSEGIINISMSMIQTRVSHQLNLALGRATL
jgi:hypothetical protein